MTKDSLRPLSVVIMTYNEESNIEQCITSVQGLGNEILVLDSNSTDRTVELARNLGARVEQYPFDTYADQRRRLITFAKNDFILTLDADEYLSEALKSSVQSALQNNSEDAFTSNRKSKIGNTWMDHGTWYPDRKIRLFDRRKVSVTGMDVHEALTPSASCKVGHLNGDLMHNADENIEARYQKVQGYSSRAAATLFRQGKKTDFLRILCKPFFRFVNGYFFRLGFLDGYYGYIVAMSEAQYVWLREVKLWEMWRNQKLTPLNSANSVPPKGGT
ncbi:MAG: glycosyltransferase family 2 protein [Saprospiraceae bacterium]